MEIPGLEPWTGDTGVPESAAEFSVETEAPEAVPLLISFRRYKIKECEMNVGGTDLKQIRKALTALRDIGMKVTDQVSFKIQMPNLETAYIERTGEYSKLYNGLGDIPDAEIFQAKIERDKARIFYFIVDKIFNVIAIKSSHIETDKVRR